MLSQGSATAVEASLRWSPLAAAVIALVYLAAGALALALAGTGLAGIVICCAMAASGVRSLRRGLWHQPVRIDWHADGTWTLTDCQGRGKKGELGQGLLAMPDAAVLNWRLEGGEKSYAVLLAGYVGRDAMRRLHLRLRGAGQA